MLEQIYKSQRKQAALKKLWLYGPVDRYLAHRGSAARNKGSAPARTVAGFMKHLHESGLIDANPSSAFSLSLS